MGNTFYFSWEVKLMEWLQSVIPEVGIKIAYYLSIFGEELLLILIMGYVYWCYDKKIGLRIGINVIVTSLLFPILKNIALRRRPYMDSDVIKCFKPVDPDSSIMDIQAQGYSFPSGHSANSLTVFGSLAYYMKNKVFVISAIVLPLLVGFSRVVLGNHYPTDVLVGWTIGLISVFVTPIIISKVKNKKITYLIFFLVAALGMTFCDSNDYFTALGMLLGLLLGNLFEEKYVKFENTRSVLKSILRVLGGILIYLGLNVILKLPFTDTFLTSQTFAQHIFRFFRYAVITFVDLGVYPMVFGKVYKRKK